MALHNFIRSLRLIVHKTTWTILNPLGRDLNCACLNLMLGLYSTAHGLHLEDDWTLNVCHSIYELTSKLLMLPSFFFILFFMNEFIIMASVSLTSSLSISNIYFHWMLAPLTFEKKPT